MNVTREVWRRVVKSLTKQKIRERVSLGNDFSQEQQAPLQLKISASKISHSFRRLFLCSLEKQYLPNNMAIFPRQMTDAKQQW